MTFRRQSPADRGAVLHFNLYSPSSSPVLFRPVLVNGKRMMENPLNGEIFPSAYLDYYVPGSGTIAPGTVTVGSPDWRGIFYSRHVVTEPRFGFAYDLFGNGKTAIRGGVGRFVAMRTFSGSIFGYIINPPSISYPTAYYGKMTRGLFRSFWPAGTSIYELWESQREVALFVLLVAWRSASCWVQQCSRRFLRRQCFRNGQYSFNRDEVPYGAEFLHRTRIRPPAHRFRTTTSVLTPDIRRSTTRSGETTPTTILCRLHLTGVWRTGWRTDSPTHIPRRLMIARVRPTSRTLSHTAPVAPICGID